MSSALDLCNRVQLCTESTNLHLRSHIPKMETPAAGKREVTISVGGRSSKTRRRQTNLLRLRQQTKSRSHQATAKSVIDFVGISNRVACLWRRQLRKPEPGACFTPLVGSTTAARVTAQRRFAFTPSGRKETALVEDMRGYARGRFQGARLSGDRAQICTMQLKGESSRKAVSVAGLYVDRVPVEEWNQIFNEVWRRYRDWFYVSNMHGFDWVGLREQYKPLLKYVAHRSDLNYVIQEMIAELNYSTRLHRWRRLQCSSASAVGSAGRAFRT